MPDAPLGRARLVAQGLVTRPYATAHAAVSDFGAMQGQDLPGVIASVALRLSPGEGRGHRAEHVLAAMDEGLLVRGYPMRGTVFLMAAEDLLWVSELCNAVMLRAAVKRRAQLELTDAMVERCAEVTREVLAGEPRGLPRADLFAHWAAGGVSTAGGRGYHVLAYLIGEGEACYGPWNGSDQNVVLTAGWIPAGTDLGGRFNGDRHAAIVELLRRYLTSHAPATLRDFAWWTKLGLRDIRAAWSDLASEFEAEGDSSEPLIWCPGLREQLDETRAAQRRPLLLPGFDEFILGYQDRLFAMTPEQHVLLVPGNNGVFGRSVVVDGLVRALWRRGGRPGRRTLDVNPFDTLSQANQKALEARFADFGFVSD